MIIISSIPYIATRLTSCISSEYRNICDVLFSHARINHPSKYAVLFAYWQSSLCTHLVSTWQKKAGTGISVMSITKTIMPPNRRSRTNLLIWIVTRLN